MKQNYSSIKAIGLLSGGLDSTLAVKMMLDQHIDVTVLNFMTPFCTCTRKGCQHEARRIATQFNIPLKIIPGGKPYITMIQHPKHGYGRNMNPCIDCRIFMFKKAKEYMLSINAQFVFTGEVLGQRPMSQHKRALTLIEKETDLEGLIVRPLSAQLLPPTIPEIKQWIDRKKLLAIQGRRRIPQIQLAQTYGIQDYPCPAGGCRLTDPSFAKRIRESFNHNESTLKDIQLLRFGRHFRLPSGEKVIVGRNEEENNILHQYHDKHNILIEIQNTGSPTTLVKKNNKQDNIQEAIGLCIKYSDISVGEPAIVKIKYMNDKEEIISFSPAEIEFITSTTYNPL
jgi:tRNA U34 2-thiouridine synthase MnmA/TrmU